MFCVDDGAWAAAAEALFATEASGSGTANGGPGPGGPGLSQHCPPGSESDTVTGLSVPGPAQHGQKRQRQSYNADQLAALSLEAQKAARGETRASNRDIAAQISELGGGRVVTAPDVGNWFRNSRAKNRQRAGPDASGDTAGGDNHAAP